MDELAQLRRGAESLYTAPPLEMVASTFDVASVDAFEVLDPSS